MTCINRECKGETKFYNGCELFHCLKCGSWFSQQQIIQNKQPQPIRLKVRKLVTQKKYTHLNLL